MRISDWSSDVCSSDLPPSAVRYHVRGCVRGNALAPEGAARTDEGGTGVGRHMSESVRRMNMIEAINSAMDVAMERDPMVTVLGEDVGYFGGVFRATAGLQKQYGKTRVRSEGRHDGQEWGSPVRYRGWPNYEKKKKI